MDYKNLAYDLKDGVGVVTFNRPSALNTLNYETILELSLLIDKIEKDDRVKVVVFTGEGKAFIAGADISQMVSMDSSKALEFAKLGQETFLKVENMSKPTISAINGFCLGGGNEFALSTDIRIATINAKFGQPETTLGITPGFAGTQRLIKQVGLSKGKRLIFTGEIINAQEAYNIGLVDKVVEIEELMNETLSLAGKISKNSVTAVRYSKKAINEGAQLDIYQGNKIEAAYFALCFAKEDQKIGMEAFLNKSKPEFIDK
jgi:enoyl-CoA hydratase